MDFSLLSANSVIGIHEKVIEPNELQGEAQNKSIASVVARVEHRVVYGLVADEFELAACYATYIAMGHAFNDANKRTAFAAMIVCLKLHGINLPLNQSEMVRIMVDVAQGKIEERELAQWLREQVE